MIDALKILNIRLLNNIIIAERFKKTEEENITINYITAKIMFVLKKYISLTSELSSDETISHKKYLTDQLKIHLKKKQR